MVKISISAIVYDMFGDTASGVFAWPKGRPQDQTYIISNGELIMSNLNEDDIIVFSYFGKTIAEIPANQIGPEIEIDKTIALDTVEISNTKPQKSNLFLKLFGFASALGIGYVVFSDNPQKVNL